MTPRGLETHYMHIRAFATSCYTSLCPLRTSQYLRGQYEPLTETPLKFDRLFQACDFKLRKQHTPWTVQSHSTSVQARGGVARAASPCAACSGGGTRSCLWTTWRDVCAAGGAGPFPLAQGTVSVLQETQVRPLVFLSTLV